MKYNINVIEPSHAGRDSLGKPTNRTDRWAANPRNANYVICAADSEIGRKAQTLDWNGFAPSLP
jgi:hypothetical protein